MSTINDGTVFIIVLEFHSLFSVSTIDTGTIFIVNFRIATIFKFLR